jgi:hypothetical protein
VALMAGSEEMPLTARPYRERQLIVVAQKGTQKANIPRTFNPLRILSNIDIPTLIVRLGIEGYRAWRKARESGLLILPISQKEAEELHFPPGHPRGKITYVGHPGNPILYYPMADFHRCLFEDKVCEAVKLLMSLGATSILVEHVQGWSKDFSSRLSLPIAKVAVSSEIKNKILFKAALSGTYTPVLPDSLVWYSHEPTWGNIAEGRLKFGLLDFSIAVSYLSNFGIDARLKDTVTKSGLELGGKFEDHQSTIWSLKGKFRPLGAL